MMPFPLPSERAQAKTGGPARCVLRWSGALVLTLFLAGCADDRSAGGTGPSWFGDAVSLAATSPPADKNQLAIADRLLAGGDEAGALRFYHDAATRADAAPDAMLRYAQLLLRVGSYDYAAGAFSEVLNRDPGQAAARRGLGAALLAGGKVDEARPHVEQAVRESADVRSIRNLAVLRALEGRLEEARGVFSKAKERWPSDLDLRINHALLEAVAGDCKAAESLGHSVTISPFVQQRHLAVDGLVLALCGQDEKARQVAGQSLSASGLAMLFKKAAEVRPADSFAARAAAVGAIPVAASAQSGRQ